jgi:hypothetical protein
MLPLSRRMLGSVAGLALALLPISAGRRSGAYAETRNASTIQARLKAGWGRGAPKAGIGNYGKLPLSFEANRWACGKKRACRLER